MPHKHLTFPFLYIQQDWNSLWISVTIILLPFSLGLWMLWLVRLHEIYIKSFDVALFTDSMNYHKHVRQCNSLCSSARCAKSHFDWFFKIFGKWQLCHARRNKSNLNQFVQAVVTQISSALWYLGTGISIHKGNDIDCPHSFLFFRLLINVPKEISFLIASSSWRSNKLIVVKSS